MSSVSAAIIILGHASTGPLQGTSEKKRTELGIRKMNSHEYGNTRNNLRKDVP